jgi:thioredoxin-dependent peroxiredoxin
MLVKDYKPKLKFSVGDKVPSFEATIQDGSVISLQQLKSDWIVLCFYPKDNTPTCIKETCNLRDHYTEIKSFNLSLFGISPDSERKHQNFISKYSLPFDLIVDKDHKIASMFGVWGKKKFMGIVYDGIHRTTFVLTNDLRIQDIIYPVESSNHHEQIIRSIKK